MQEIIRLYLYAGNVGLGCVGTELTAAAAGKSGRGGPPIICCIICICCWGLAMYGGIGPIGVIIGICPYWPIMCGGIILGIIICGCGGIPKLTKIRIKLTVQFNGYKRHDRRPMILSGRGIRIRVQMCTYLLVSVASTLVHHRPNRIAHPIQFSVVRALSNLPAVCRPYRIFRFQCLTDLETSLALCRWSPCALACSVWTNQVRCTVSYDKCDI